MNLKLITVLIMIFGLTTTSFADITFEQKDGICRVSLARINGNAPGEYKLAGKSGDIIRYKSSRGYTYECEIFSSGLAFTLSSKGWGRLKPSGSVRTEGNCSDIQLFDPGLGIKHSLKSCVK